MKIRHKKLRFNLKRILSVGLFGFVLITCLNLGLRVTAANINEITGKPAYVEVMVKSGDSLWELTEKHYTGNQDLRKVIYKVKEINNLENVNIIPGQIIKIPQY